MASKPAYELSIAQPSWLSERLERLFEFIPRLPLPRSILGLVLIGFLLVTLPLFVSVAGGVYYVDELVLRSERLVTQGIQVTRTSELLVELIRDMERNARQYQVLAEPALLELYQEKHDLFAARVNLLENLAPEGATSQLFEQLRADGNAVLDVLNQHGQQPVPLTAPNEQVEKVVEHFGSLSSLAVGLTNQSSRLIDEKMDMLYEAANQARSHLYWQTAALIPIALLFALVFTVLITRPIGQLRGAIRTLGEGSYTHPIMIGGPPELQTLGHQLDWLRQRLAESEAEQNQFLRHISHELKTPLASVREGADLLADGTVGDLSENQHEVATILRDNSLELQMLIENLLNFSAWQEKRAKIQPERVSLLTLLQELAAKYQLAISAQELRLALPAADIIIQADSSLLATALDNLLSNAVKFSPQGGTIKIMIQRNKRLNQIDVMDNGRGIAAADKDRIFEPFYKGKTPEGARLRGTGIGLSLARECIQAHNGTLEVIEDNHNGAHFRITLPQSYV